jgi:lipopolysaccharide export LptBFGC system permease protein LptF
MKFKNKIFPYLNFSKSAFIHDKNFSQYLPLTSQKNIQEIPTDKTPSQDSLIARGWQKEQYIGITILLICLIAVVGFFSRRFEYALIFALTLSIILIVFFLKV